MVRAHAYPVLGAISTAALVVIAIAMIPIAKQAHSFNSCVEELLYTPGMKPPIDLSHGLRVSLCNGRDGYDAKSLHVPRRS